MKKTDITDFLQKNGESTLGGIYDGLFKNDSTVNKPIILHHLKGLTSLGSVIKTKNRTYKLPNFFGLPAKKAELISIPLIVAKAGPDDKLINENLSEFELNQGQFSYKTEDLVMVKISGNSMEPTFKNSDMVLFRKSLEMPKDNDIVLWRVDDGAKVKRFRKGIDENGFSYGLLLSDNSNDLLNKPIKVNDDNSSFIGIFVSKMDL